jgi:type I restriction enzyme M protein
MNLSSTVKSIQDIMRKDDGVDGDAQRIGQLTWMLFLKIFDQREEEWEDEKPKYKSPLPRRFRWRNWAAYKSDTDGKRKPQISASELIPFINNELFPALREKIDPGRGPQHKVIKQVFEDSYNYMRSGPLMLAVIEKLEDAIDFHDFKTRAQLGTIYEQILNDLRSAGNAGEFYTPRAITEFMVAQVDPRLAKRESVLDPACGTGGFLTATIDHFRGQLSNKASTKDKRAMEQLIRGIEKKQLPHLLCTTNMLLHGIDVPSQITRENTLSREWNDWTRSDRVDCVITNPPFGGYEEDAVGGTFPPDLRTRETADMFVVLIITKLLKDHGRAAIVLPDGFLFGEGIKSKLKERLLRECNLHTIVRLPKGVFSPYTSIKTNLLFFTKGKHTESIWFYEHPYPSGYKSYSRTKPIVFEEFKAEQQWWGTEDDDFAAREENAFAWKVDFETRRDQAHAAAQPHWQRAEELNNKAAALEDNARRKKTRLNGKADDARRKKIIAQVEDIRQQAEALRLKARDAQAAGDRLYWPIYNLDSRNPNGPEEESHDPDVLLDKYRKLLGEIEETQNELKGELAAALAHHFAGKKI